MSKCEFCGKNGSCRKYGDGLSCDDIKINETNFKSEFGVCSVEGSCKRGSIFGNAYYMITKEQLQKLKEGKVLFDVDEYGTFIMLDKEARENDA